MIISVVPGRYDLELRCPRCGIAGKVSVRDEPTFTVEKLPPQFRILHRSEQPQDVKLACRCGQVFDLKGARQKL